MDPLNRYRRQVQLLLRLLPIVATQTCFAIKGGTAINLFDRDLPRLSVDIDLVYLPLQGREMSLQLITNSLQSIADQAQQALPKSRCIIAGPSRTIVRYDNTQVKIEVNEVLRGTVHPVQWRAVSAATEREFGYAEAQVVAFEDLYAGKICAALDRQHPRDLFDCQQLLSSVPTLPAPLLDTFIVYLISHNRPIAELLNPRLADISGVFEQEFRHMPRSTITLKSLETARLQLIDSIRGGLTETHKAFLLSFKSLKPQWHLLSLPDIEKLPSVRWKLQNIANMSAVQHKQAVRKLEQTLQI